MCSPVPRACGKLDQTPGVGDTGGEWAGWEKSKYIFKMQPELREDLGSAHGESNLMVTGSWALLPLQRGAVASEEAQGRE